MLELWEHQKEGVQFGLQRDNALYLWQVGTGKTPLAINLVRHRSAEKKALIKTLILGPVAILQQFKDEFEKFSKITPDNITVLKGSGKKKAEQVAKLGTDDHIIVTNYEALLNADLHKALVKWGPELAIMDEIHMLKNYKAKRSKLTARVAHQCKYRYGLTGTGILQGPQDLFMVHFVLDKGETFGTNFFAFRGRYMVDQNAAWSGRPNHFPKWIPNEVMYEELTNKIFANASQKNKEECIDLPEFLRKTEYVEMPPEMKKLYDQMERDFMIFLDEQKDSDKSGAVVANLAITKSMKMMQIVTGFAIDEEGNTITLKKNPKMEALEELLDQLRGEKVIVWAAFKHNHKQIAQLCKKMEINYVLVNGDVSASDKQDAIKKFQEDTKTTVFIGSQAAAGTGVNLQVAGYSIYFSKNHRLGDDIQSEGRNFRGGSIDYHKSVTRIDLVMRDSIDELVDESLANKQEVSDKILNYRR